MSVEKNKYYRLESIGPEAVADAETLLKQYPLTRMFLEILGRYLMEKIQFGIFSPGAEIIIQGEKGKDLFLICNHLTDVVVNTKQILQLQAPVMVGDKGIIDRESVRNATIRISEGADSLVVKIPLELFIRSFKKQNIKDKEFAQEKKIYYHLFLEVQERLFKYAEIQKNLWEDINTSLNALNIQLIAGSLNQQKEKAWGDKGWNAILEFLARGFGVSWPEGTARNMVNLTGILKKLLDKKMPRAGFRGTDQQFAFKKQMAWKSWLNSLAEVLVKAIPSEQLPVSIGEVELFNPRIYQMRVSHLLRSTQKKFMLKKVKPKMGEINADLLKASRFFGKEVKKHEFNLDAYTKAVNDQFVFKNPNRVMAQLTQQIAQLTATCENEFNESVSKMQHFLEKIKNLTLFKNDPKETATANDKIIRACVSNINLGFKAYHKRMMGQAQIHVGEIRFNDTGSPVILDLVKSCGSDQIRKKVSEANQKLIKMLGLTDKEFGVAKVSDLIHFCEAYPSDIVSPYQLARHYWIPISPGITLDKMGKPFNTIRPGMMIGGKSWDLAEDEDIDSENAWNLTLPEEELEHGQSLLIGVIPSSSLPWVVNNAPNDPEFENHYLPLFQWLFNRHLSHLALSEQVRDLLFDRYARISEVIVTEKKVRQFEHNKAIVSEQEFHRIRALTMETLGMDLGKNPRISSQLLSKQIYNWLLEQTKRDFPNLTIEDQGNKAYTLWRFMQSQIVKEVLLKDETEEFRPKSPDSVFDLITMELQKRITKKGMEYREESMDLLSTSPEIRLGYILENTNLDVGQKVELCLEMMQILEKYSVMLTDEANDYQGRLKAINSVKTEFDVQEVQEKFISESIEKLQISLYQKISQKESQSSATSSPE